MADSKKEKMKIQLFGLNDAHPNKKQMEWFLNNFEEEFIVDKESIKTMDAENLIQKEYFFYTKMTHISLILVFCKTQQDALSIGEHHFSSDDNKQKYGANGAVLIVTKGKDELKVNSVLSWFSGEE